MKTVTMTLAAGIAALSAGTALAQVELSLAHWVGATHPLQVTGMEPWAKSIEEASAGRIKIVIYPAQQLGAAADHYDMARDGIADISFINTGYQPGRFPVIALNDIPLTVSDAKAGARGLHEWYAQYAADEMADVYVCMMHMHAPGTIHSKSGPFAGPEDLKGKNIRPANGATGRLVNLAGAASVQGAAGEMRDMLEKGTADATGSPWGSLFTFGAQDLVKHHLDMPLYVSTFAYVMNKDTIDGLSAEDRAVLDAHCTPEWSERISGPWVDVEAAGRDKIAALGDHTLYVPTEAQMQGWRDLVAPLHQEWEASITAKGHDPAAIKASYAEIMGKYNALVK